MRRLRVLVVLALILVLVALGVVLFGGEDEEDGAGLPNPASVYCEEQGGELEIREGEGGQYGVCLFPDGSLCEEWRYYRGECNQGEYFEK